MIAHEFTALLGMELEIDADEFAVFENSAPAEGRSSKFLDDSVRGRGELGEV